MGNRKGGKDGMLRNRELKRVLEGSMLLEYLGNTYECIGAKNGSYCMQSMDDDSYILCSHSFLETSKYCYAVDRGDLT